MSKIESSGPITYASGYKYVLRLRWWCKTPFVDHALRLCDAEGRLLASLDSTGQLTVLPGYAWDGASGPTINSPSSMRASLAHDVMYQAMREGHFPVELRERVDVFFRRLLVQDGMWRWRAALWFRAVRRYAAFAARRQDETLVVAP